MPDASVAVTVMVCVPISVNTGVQLKLPPDPMLEKDTLEFAKESLTEYVGFVNPVEVAVNVTLVPVTTPEPGDNDVIVTVGESANAKRGARKMPKSNGATNLLIYKIYNHS